MMWSITVIFRSIQTYRELYYKDDNKLYPFHLSLLPHVNELTIYSMSQKCH